jgi:hypothetical protein
MSFFKGFEKTALVGPLTDLANLGIPSAIGYHIGRGHGKEEGEKEVNPPSTLNKTVKALLIPGYMGYRIGKHHGHEMAKKEKKK